MKRAARGTRGGRYRASVAGTYFSSFMFVSACVTVRTRTDAGQGKTESATESAAFEMSLSGFSILVYSSKIVWLTEKTLPIVQRPSLVGSVSLHGTTPQRVLEARTCPARNGVTVSRGVIEQANNALEEHMRREHPELAKRFVIPDLMKEVWKERVRKALVSMVTR